MYTNHINAVALANQNKFCQAIFTLMQRKDIEKITVTELCREAGLERVTFYRSFDTKQDVIQYYLDRQMTLLIEQMPANSTLEHNMKALFEWTYRERKNLCILMDCRMTVLLTKVLSEKVLALLWANLAEGQEKRWQSWPFPENTAKELTFGSGMAMGVYCGLLTAWRDTGFVDPPEALAARMGWLFTHEVLNI